MQLQSYRKEVNRLIVDKRRVDQNELEELKAKNETTAHLNSIAEAQEISQRIAKSLQQQAHIQIAKVVTQCLNAVFDDPYEFQIQFECKRGKTEAKLVFIRDGMVLNDPMNEVGGGVIDVAGLALRLSCILLSRPAKRKLVVLDEPFKNIRGEENKKRTREMLLRLSEELGLSFIINTDIKSYQLGTIVELGEEQ